MDKELYEKNKENRFDEDEPREKKESGDLSRLEVICEGALYQEIKKLKDGKSIVMDPETERLYYRKELSVYNVPVFEYLKENKSKWIPEIKVFWEEENKLICIEEYIQGKTLEEYLYERPSFDERVRILLDVCDGISFLHDAPIPIIHRDIKASNIMITNEGNVKIIDYDSAKIFDSNKEKDTVLIGTQGIAAPEQYGFGQSDERTDIYAMGKLVERVVPEARNADKVVSKATKIDPSLRYRNMKELRNQIENLWDPQISNSLRRKMTLHRIINSKQFVVSMISLVITVSVIICAVLFKIYVYPTWFIYKPAYERGIEAMEKEDYQKAIDEFDKSADYKNSNELRQECVNGLYLQENVSDAEKSIETYWSSLKPEDARTALIKCKNLTEYGEDGTLLESFRNDLLDYIDECCERQNWYAATNLYNVLYLTGYEPAADGESEVEYKKGEYYFDRENYADAYTTFQGISGYKDADERALESGYQNGIKKMNNGDYVDAVEAFELVQGYSNADEERLLAMYKYCDKMKEKRDLTAKKYMDILLEEKYPGAQTLSEILYAWHAQVTLLDDGWSGNSRCIMLKIKVTGGPYLETAKINVKVYDENNQLDFDETKEDVVTGKVTQMRYFYDYNKGKLEDRTLYIEVYDGDGNLIGSCMHYAK